MPLALDSFVGREAELAEISALLRRTRLITLLGPGGQGKTRLVRELLSRTASSYPDGAWFVELGSIADGTLVIQHVAAVLGVREQPGTPVSESLAQYLAPRSVLLVLDNCEHVIDSAARLVAGLLERCPALRVLCTSRESLELPGEALFRVGELALPTPSDATVSSGAEPGVPPQRSEAVRLFVERARAAVPGFELTAENADQVAAVCVRLDGSPLAIELAARRVRLLPVSEILARLDDRFALLTAGPRTAVERHRDLRSAIDWSYQLLSPAEQSLFRRLSVFAARFTEAGAAAVCPDVPPEGILDLLGGLEGKSLIVADGDGQYRQLESIRYFGAEMLSAADEVDLTYDRLAGWLLELAEPVLGGVRLVAAAGDVAVLAEQADTLVRAVEWTAARGDDRRVLLAAALGYGWLRRGHLTEGRRILRAALAETDPAYPGRTPGLIVAASMAQGQSDAAESLALASEAYAREECGQRPLLLARALVTIQIAQHSLGDLAGSFETAQRCVLAARALDPLDLATCIHNVAYGALARGDLDEAAARLDECFALRRSHSDEPAPPAWWHTGGTLALARGDLDTAEAKLRAGLAGCTLSRPVELAAALGLVDGLVIVAARRGDLRRTLRLGGALWAQIEAHQLDSGEVWHETAAIEALAKARREFPGHEAVEAAGRRLDLAETVAYALHDRWTERPDETSVLTDRELHVAELVAAGFTNRQIASRLHISVRTVSSHLEHVRTKLDIRSRTLIVAWVLKNGARRAAGQLKRVTPS